MFEDSTFESTGRIHSRSRAWLMAAFAFNASLLLALILIPLLNPQALPRLSATMLIAVPTVPISEPKPIVKPANAVVVATTAASAAFSAPSRIPDKIYFAERPEIAAAINAASMDPGGSISGGIPFAGMGKPSVAVAHPEPKKSVRISGLIVEGMLVQKIAPVYPAIARAAGVQGTVSLSAVIARDGTIQHLQVLSGAPMLQRAALDAVRNWRYRPYLLSGEPVEVETSINVIFNLHN